LFPVWAPNGAGSARYVLCRFNLLFCLRVLRKPADEILAFSEDAVNHVVAAYGPLVSKHKDDAFTPEQKEWQAIRRGRYVEFNLVSWDGCGNGAAVAPDRPPSDHWPAPDAWAAV
jgi:hypothetical protein